MSTEYWVLSIDWFVSFRLIMGKGGGGEEVLWEYSVDLDDGKGWMKKGEWENSVK